MFVDDVEICIAIVVIIAPGSVAGIANVVYACGCANFREGAVAVVVEEGIAKAFFADVEIDVAVIVKVGPGCGCFVALGDDIDACAASDVGEGSVAVVAIELVLREELSDIKVEVAVVVIVDPMCVNTVSECAIGYAGR